MSALPCNGDGCPNPETLAGKISITIWMVIVRQVKHVFPVLRRSTQTAGKSLLELHIRPKWGEYCPLPGHCSASG
jgi:hypothetical protein